MSRVESDNRTSKLAEAFYRRQWDRFPSVGSFVGVEEYDARLEAPDENLLMDELSDAARTLRELGAIPAPGPGSDTGDILDRREFEAQLRLKILHLESIRNWSRNPADPADGLVTSLYYLLMRRDVALESTALALISRLEKAGDYLGAVQSRITDPVGLWVDVALEITEGGRSFVADLARALTERHPKLAAEIRTAAARATDALSGTEGWLRDLAGKDLKANPAVGAEALQGIVRWNHGLGESLDEIRDYARAQMESLKARQTDIARSIDPNATPREIMKKEGRRYAGGRPDILAEYTKATFEIRDRLVSEGVLDLPPGESCTVLSTPDFLRPLLPTAAYSSPGPLDRIQRGIFYVSDPPKTLPDEEYLANVAQHFPIEPTCAHEAYPGHHLQLCWANRAPSLIRKLADHIIFMEGWTLYCEQLMVELGWYATKVHELGYLNDQLWRACRIVIDADVHSGRMSVAEARAMLEREVGFTPLRAKTELNWYTQSPGTPMSYLLGKGKTLALRDSYRRKHPGSSLKDFHGWLLGHGSVPQTWLMEMLS
jgi:hypothetical protein